VFTVGARAQTTNFNPGDIGYVKRNTSFVIGRREKMRYLRGSAFFTRLDSARVQPPILDNRGTGRFILAFPRPSRPR
jgi:hypothetical protein